MLYLLLAILCSSSIALIFKYSETSNTNRYAITTMNYVTACIISLITLKTVNLNFKFTVSEMINGLQSNMSGTMTQAGSMLWAIILGIIGGFFFLFSFLYYQKSIKESGASLSGMFGKLGILVPMIFSVVLWKEIPTSIQIIGIVLAIVSILIVNLDFAEIRKSKINRTLILLFIYGGMAEFSNKIFLKYALIEYKSLFLLMIFFTAFIMSLTYLRKNSIENKGKDIGKIKKRDLLLGLAVGIPNLYSSFFLIEALNDIAAAVVFPVYSASSILVITLMSRILFKEQLRKKDFIAIGLTVVSVILINM